MSEQSKNFIGFRVTEIPLGVVREICKTHSTPGAQALVDATLFEDDLIAVAVNDSDGSLTLVKDPNDPGHYKKLKK